MELNKILEERKKTHGDFSKQSLTSQAFKEEFKKSPNYQKMPPAFKEGIEMILHKLARAMHGDFREIDHYRDIQGYAELIIKNIIKEEKNVSI